MIVNLTTLVVFINFQGLGGVLRRPAKPRGGARVSQSNEDLLSRIASLTEEKEEMKERMARLEASLNKVISAQAAPGDNTATPAAPLFIPDKSSCASAGILGGDQDEEID